MIKNYKKYINKIKSENISEKEKKIIEENIIERNIEQNIDEKQLENVGLINKNGIDIYDAFVDRRGGVWRNRI